MSEHEQVELPKELLERARPLAEQLGFDSVNDLIAHLLQRVLDEAAGVDESDRADLLERLRDLGYL